MSALYDARTSDLHDIDKQLRLSWERTSDALEKMFHHSATDDETRAKLLGNTRKMSSTAANAQVSIDGFTEQVGELPNVEKMLTRSQRKLVRELREFLAYIEDVKAFEERLTGILESVD